MNVDYDITALDNCSITISGLNSYQLDDLRIILYHLYKYKESSKMPNPFGIDKVIKSLQQKQCSMRISKNETE